MQQLEVRQGADDLSHIWCSLPCMATGKYMARTERQRHHFSARPRQTLHAHTLTALLQQVCTALSPTCCMLPLNISLASRRALRKSAGATLPLIFLMPVISAYRAARCCSRLSGGSFCSASCAAASCRASNCVRRGAQKYRAWSTLLQ